MPSTSKISITPTVSDQKPSLWRRLFPKNIREKDSQTRKDRRIVFIMMMFLLAGTFACGLYWFNDLKQAYKTWLAHSYLNDSQGFLTKQNPSDALESAFKAYKLAPNDPETVRHMATLSTYAKWKESIYFWNKLRDLRAFKTDDELMYVRALENTGDAKRAERELDLILGRPNPTTNVFIFGSEYYYRTGRAKQALDLIDKAVKMKPEDRALRLQQSAMSLEIGSSAQARSALSTLWKMAEDKDQNGKNALTYLNALRLNSREESERFLTLLSNHPMIQEVDEWVAFDRRLTLQPGNRKQILEEAKKRMGEIPAQERIPWFGWLLEKKEFTLILNILTEEELNQYPTFLDPYVQALDGMGRMEEAMVIVKKRMTTLSAAQVSLLNAYLIYRQAKSQEATQKALKEALEFSRLENRPEFVMKVAKLARIAGFPVIARQSYELARSHPLTSKEAIAELVSMALSNNDEEEVLHLLRGSFWDWVLDSTLLEEAVYICLLTGADMEVALDRSEWMHNEVPGDPVRTLLYAFALYRESRFNEALQQIQDIRTESLSIGQRAIYARILASGGKREEAHLVVSQLPLSLLLSTERRLVDDLK